SSYACYYDSKRQTYISDCYSINWMRNTEESDVNRETFEAQYNLVEQETLNTSNVCQYGDMSISVEKLRRFFVEHERHRPIGVKGDIHARRDPVDQRDVELEILYRKLRVPNELAKPEIRKKIDE